MPYNFTTTQLNKINTLFTEAQAKGEFAKGAYAQAYQYVADVLAGKVDQAPGQPAPWSLGKDVQQVQLWFAGAARANAGEGPFATLIWEYTQAQAELRGMGRFSDQMMQRASNEVGRRALSAITDRNGDFGKMPDMETIATKDASAVGDVLFPNVPNAKQNPGWTGGVLFGLMGSDQTWRLYNPDGTVRDSTQCMDVGYAKVAYNKALEKTVTGFSVMDISTKDFDVLSGMAKLQLGMDPGAYTNPTSYPLLAMTGAGSTIIGANSTLQKLSASFAMCSAKYFTDAAPTDAPEIVITASRIKDPGGLGTTRNSASFITDTSANDHLAILKEGGTLSDLWVLQKNSTNGFANAQDFYKAILASNPAITDVNKIPAGTTLYLPEKISDGSITYNFANGVSINSNAVNGEYHMVVPNVDGGQTVYSRMVDGEAGYTVREVSTDKDGKVLVDYTCFQDSVQSDIKSINLTELDGSTGQTTATDYTHNATGYQSISTVKDGQGNPLSQRKTTTHDDGSSQTDTTNTQTGTTSSVTRDSDGNIFRRADTVAQPDGSSVTQEYNRAGDLLSTTTRKVEDDGSYTETVTTDKGTVKNTYDTEGQLDSTQTVDAGMNNIGYAVGAATSFLSLVKALQDGKPLPIVVSGVNTLAAFDKLSTNGYGASNLTLSGTQNVLGAASSLYNLSVAWKQNDATGVFAAGASSLYYGGTAYANMLGYSNVGTAAASGAISGELASAIGAAGQVMPYLNLVNALAHGDTTGAALAAVSIVFPVAGAVIGIASMIFSMFDDPPTPWGNGNFAFNDDGTIRINASGGDGGYEPVYNTLAAYQSNLQSIVVQYNQAASKTQIGLVANRMGSLSYNGGQWTLTTLNPETGGQITLHYGSDGKVQDAAVGTPEYFRSMGEQYMYSALQSGAIAAGWEVQTAAKQSALGDPMAGLTEVQRAQRANQYLGAQQLTSVGSGGALGSWRAIALDLQGDGIHTVAEDKSGVVFDVDGTGYAKQTAWVGKGDGMLVLDRNFNGVIDTGSELFGNTQVALGAQGLKGLAWTDANVDGDIDTRDAVYSQLRVWQDANGNGLVDTGEAKSLVDMGISSIHYNRGSYDKNGQSLQVSSVDLQVHSVGTKVEQVAGGIKIESTNGKVSVLVTKTDDLSNIAPVIFRHKGASCFRHIGASCKRSN